VYDASLCVLANWMAPRSVPCRVAVLNDKESVKSSAIRVAGTMRASSASTASRVEIRLRIGLVLRIGLKICLRALAQRVGLRFMVHSQLHDRGVGEGHHTWRRRRQTVPRQDG